ncbi:WXG100 family type VII secretion target [Mycobacteroides abscessus]|uniref:WXG100 family type VII secretion target n=1 Tax=Mycobacteroides abscessus TaxID=36809 RepID=UPI000C259CC0|nr:WXG100 family type VII secretion target [Mycobacteroides abscessus]PVB19718.1 hypothetical protein DDJ40_08120 [Mycobacteroides abscessus]PVB24462.1 hypothetical protein DDJ71_06335 [Mycobacteroides abscessus]RIU40320.1 hypothetical protein D2E83_11135 [Mycobacteroides abscessus]
MSEPLHVAFDELQRTAAVLRTDAETWRQEKKYVHESIQAIASRFSAGSSGRAMTNLIEHWEQQTSDRHDAFDGHCDAHEVAAHDFMAVEERGVDNFRTSGR